MQKLILDREPKVLSIVEDITCTDATALQAQGIDNVGLIGLMTLKKHANLGSHNEGCACQASMLPAIEQAMTQYEEVPEPTSATEI
jgi:hypothetical protein